jgi:catalase
MLSYFYKADKDYGTRVTAIAKGDLTEVKKLADSLTD